MGNQFVSISKGTNPEKMVEEALSLLGGLKLSLSRIPTVVIKPNAGHPIRLRQAPIPAPPLLALSSSVAQIQPKEIILRRHPH